MFAQLYENNKQQPALKINQKNFLLTNALNIHMALEELKKLNTGLKIKFENFHQFNDLIQEINFAPMKLSSIPTEQLLNELKRRTNY